MDDHKRVTVLDGSRLTITAESATTKYGDTFFIMSVPKDEFKVKDGNNVVLNAEGIAFIEVDAAIRLRDFLTEWIDNHG